MFQETYKGDHITLIACISAVGNAIPPTIIFTGKTVEDMDPCGFDITCAASGWVDTKIKKNWFENFLKYTATPDPRILFIDGHTSNFDIEIYNLAKLNNVTIIQFPSNSTHLVQPLDLLFFRLLKDGVRKELSDARKNKKEIKKCDIPQLLEDPWRKATCRGTIRKSFELSGMYPLKFKFDHLALSDSDYLKQVLLPDKQLVPSTNPTPIVFQTNVSLSNPTQIDANELNQATNSISMSKVEVISLLNDELKDFISQQIQEAVAAKKNKKKGSNKGNIITSPEMKRKLEIKKRKKLENEIKDMEEMLKQKKLLHSSIPEDNHISIPLLALPAPTLLALPAPTPLTLPPIPVDDTQPSQKKRRINEFFATK